MASPPTIIVLKGGVSYKLCKVWIEKDGSFYVTVPYHPAKKALFMKHTIDYDAATEWWQPYSAALEVAVLDDDEARPKLSHHPDGFCQFSGRNIVSGKDDAGKPKGIGVFTRPLPQIMPGAGPRFGMAVQGIEVFDRQEKARANDITFVYDELNATPEMVGLTLEGYYFQPDHRRFVRTLADGSKSISIVHPSGAVLPLRVLLSPDDCKLPGFLGLELFAARTAFPEPAFTLNGPGENSRTDERGHRIADVIISLFPGPKSVACQRDIGYRPPEGRPE